MCLCLCASVSVRLCVCVSLCLCVFVTVGLCVYVSVCLTTGSEGAGSKLAWRQACLPTHPLPDDQPIKCYGPWHPGWQMQDITPPAWQIDGRHIGAKSMAARTATPTIAGATTTQLLIGWRFCCVPHLQISMCILALDCHCILGETCGHWCLMIPGPVITNWRLLCLPLGQRLARAAFSTQPPTFDNWWSLGW